jgi:predicted ABC-type ATPase
MAQTPPTLWLVAGPNGVGKTTYAFRHIRQVAGSARFINLDEIARGLSPLDPDAGRLEASRIALRLIESLLADAGGRTPPAAFTIETTLAGVAHHRTVARARARGWRVALLYFAVRDVETCLARIARRVAEGGHDVPEADARRRFHRSIANLPGFIAEVDVWRVFDNTLLQQPRIVAEGRRGCAATLSDLSALPEPLAAALQALPPCAEAP